MMKYLLETVFRLLHMVVPGLWRFLGSATVDLYTTKQLPERDFWFSHIVAPELLTTSWFFNHLPKSDFFWGLKLSAIVDFCMTKQLFEGDFRFFHTAAPELKSTCTIIQTTMMILRIATLIPPSKLENPIKMI